MIHSVKIDDSYPLGKRLVEELRHYPKVVEFQNQASTGSVSDEYMTGEEFVKRGKERILQYYKENDYSQTTKIDLL